MVSRDRSGTRGSRRPSRPAAGRPSLDQCARRASGPRPYPPQAATRTTTRTTTRVTRPLPASPRPGRAVALRANVRRPRRVLGGERAGVAFTRDYPVGDSALQTVGCCCLPDVGGAPSSFPEGPAPSWRCSSGYSRVTVDVTAGRGQPNWEDVSRFGSHGGQVPLQNGANGADVSCPDQPRNWWLCAVWSAQVGANSWLQAGSGGRTSANHYFE